MEIEKQLLGFIQASTGSAVDVDTDLIVTHLLDSLLLMELVMLTEAQWGVSLQGDDIASQNFQTVSKLATLIEARHLAKAC